MDDLLELLSDTETKQELKEAYEDGRVKFLEGDKGFVAWIETVVDGQVWIYIHDLYIIPQERTLANMREFYGELNKFFKEKYPEAVFYWEKKGRFCYR